MACEAPKLRIPSTQNTAPILEFRCLYTHDLRQKKKRWQDGILRFHTFNKRVMVYDVPLNFIGDTHWRAEEAVQDGAELRLDKGVLVEVGEATGTTEQDLTELLEKARPVLGRSIGDASARSKHSPIPKSSMVPLAQLRPKSLNALLGTPRGAYGRAVLPAKSPFESRTPDFDRSQENQRPPKRPRLDDSIHSVTLTAPAASAQCKKMPSGLQTNISKPTPSRTTILPKPMEHEVVSIDSDDDTRMPLNLVEPGESRLSGPSATKLKLSMNQCTSSRLRRVDQKTSTPPQKNAPKAIGAAIEDDRQGAGIQPLVRAEERTPVNRLRSAVIKSRRKLMYRELIRPKATSVSSRSDTRVHITDEVDEITKLNTPFPITYPHLSVVSTLGSKNTVIHTGCPKTFTDAHTSNTERILAGERWVPPENGQHVRHLDEEEPAFVNQTCAQETNTGMEFACMESISHVPRKPIITPKVRDLTAAQPLQCTATNSTPRNDPIPDYNIKDQTTYQNENLLSSLAAIPGTRDVSHDPGRPVHLGAVLGKAQVLDPPQLPRRSPLKKALSESNKSGRLPKKLPTKLPLQRASSDLGRTGRKLLVTTEIVREDPLVQGKDIGPWGREAFDIFGWKPGGRKELVGSTPESS